MPLFSPKLVAILMTSLTLAILIASPATAGVSLSSGQNKVSVVELYTSEGCSSCPPADRWLSKFKDNELLFKQVIPLAFHVDYWNYLGWRDEFSAAAHSARQRSYNRVGRTASVYTPGFIINGEEWRGFFKPAERNTPPLARESNNMPGELTLLGVGDHYEMTFVPSQLTGNLVVNLVYLGTGISNKIRRGENAGKQLEHDFVVLGMTHARMKESGGRYVARLKTPLVSNGTARAATALAATAVAAWISKPDDPAPIQAVGGWLAVH